MTQQQQPESFTKFLAQADNAAKAIKEVTDKDGFVSCFSHLDADGVAAAGVISKMLSRLGARYRIRVMQWVDEKIIAEVTADKPNLVIMTDFGSGYLDLLNEKIPNYKIVILDHHQITGKPG
jgi:RecJ-like exonuclease